MAINRNRRFDATLAELVKKREFTVGVLTVAIAIAGVLILIRGNMQKNSQLSHGQESAVARPTGVSPKDTDGSMAQSAQSGPVVKKLADTSGERADSVQNGDNYWKISMRNCGTGRYYLSIQAYNGNKPLQPGDLVFVRCEE